MAKSSRGYHITSIGLMPLIKNSKFLQINEPIDFKAIGHMHVLQCINTVISLKSNN